MPSLNIKFETSTKIIGDKAPKIFEVREIYFY